ncbi:MAG: hypothetical protein A2Z37_16960 [Chloroflexi bacterium RBG_19FT_COMBO_62_14]|nr:MAG: hypothetical protein A2Z37_16960 [Chloroflexi bacterium RBG_19FT_COMBO_62_14]
MSIIAPLALNSDAAVRRVIQELMAAGLQVSRSFDLQSAHESLADPDECACPYHGTARCTCQYIVLLAHPEGSDPVAIELHGHDKETHMALVEVAGVAQDEETVRLVKAALAKLVTVPAVNT